MTCTCQNGTPSTASTAIGTTRALSRTVFVGAGKVVQVAGTSATRRSCTVVNQSADNIWVSYGQDQPVAGGGPGIQVGPGQSLKVDTTDAVLVLNPAAATAQVGYIEETY